MEKSNPFSSLVDQPKDGVNELKIVLDNVADTGDAAAKGALTGLTFGAKGSHVQAVTKVYRHAIHTTGCLSPR